MPDGECDGRSCIALTTAKYDPNASISSILQPFFSHPAAQLLAASQRDLILRVIPNVSWSTEKKLRQAGQWSEWHETCSELHAVQDADRLDAVGAVGVMRCAAYSAVTGRRLLNDDGGDDTAEGHFGDKLLLIRERMKVDSFVIYFSLLIGRLRGAERRQKGGMRRYVLRLTRR